VSCHHRGDELACALVGAQEADKKTDSSGRSSPLRHSIDLPLAGADVVPKRKLEKERRPRHNGLRRLDEQPRHGQTCHGVGAGGRERFVPTRQRRGESHFFVVVMAQRARPPFQIRLPPSCKASRTSTMVARSPQCPNCGESIADRDERHAPFCSARCKLVDLSGWLGGRYAIPSTPADDEDGSGLSSAPQAGED
jgi:endogenous inhibitor of DNA gyrase (YacG/DUF329 family)